MNYHYVIHGGISVGTDNLGINGFIAKMMCMGGKIGVNIFIVISSYFLCDTTVELDSAYRKIKDIYCIVWFYSISIYFISVLGLKNTFAVTDLIHFCFPIIFSTNWYATAYIIFLLLIPFLNILINYLPRSMHKILCIIMMFWLSIVPTLLGEIYITASNHASNIVWFASCYLLVSYIKKYKIEIKRKFCILMTISCYLFFAVSILLIDYFNIRLCFGTVQNSIYFMQINSVPVVICSYALFGMLCGINLKSRIINYISSLTFGVYLIHDNIIINNIIWQNICKSSVCFENKGFYLYALIGILSVYVVCCFIESGRKLIFQVISKERKLYENSGNDSYKIE